jgi:putative transposase
MIAFIEDQRIVCGVESICKVLPIAPSTFYHRLVCRADPSKTSAGHQRDAELRPEIKRVWDDNYQVYGVRKGEPLKAPLVQAQWRTHQMKREGFTLARCTVDRLMKQLGIRGAVRGKVVKTTVPDTSVPCPRDKVNRKFRAPAPNMLWVSDFTYVSTWQGFIYVAFIIDTFADRIVGWRVSRSAKTDFVLDALEQALYDRRPVQKGGQQGLAPRRAVTFDQLPVHSQPFMHHKFNSLTCLPCRPNYPHSPHILGDIEPRVPICAALGKRVWQGPVGKHLVQIG